MAVYKGHQFSCPFITLHTFSHIFIQMLLSSELDNLRVGSRGTNSLIYKIEQSAPTLSDYYEHVSFWPGTISPNFFLVKFCQVLSFSDLSKSILY